MLQPDYNNSIVNLVSSLAIALGGEARGYEPLAALRGMALSEQPHLLLIVDGLGDIFLQSSPDSFLCRHRKGRLTSVFPPTTATAVTSFFTGVAPQQHAITGWHTYFRELGTVGTVLPFVPRYRGPCFSAAGIMPEQLIGQESLLRSLPSPCHVVLPNYLLDSDYSRTLSGRAVRHGYGTLAELFSRIEQLATSPQTGLVIAYWPELDSLAHVHGLESPEVAGHFLELDKACQDSLPRVAERGATVIVTADHGLLDTSNGQMIHLDEHPRLAAMLTLPLCGEPRCAYCYVRSDRREEFERYVADHLGHACELRSSRELIGQGYFGRGRVSPRLAERIGEYTLLMKENYTIRDRLLSEKNFQQRGVHGGLSPEELYVPLIILGQGLS